MTDRERRQTEDDLYADDRREDLDTPGAGTAGGGIGGAVAGAIAGTAIGGPIGTAVGAAVGAVAGGALGFAADATADDGIPPAPGDDISTGGGAPLPGAGAGLGMPPAQLAGGVGGIGIGATGLPTASSEQDEIEIERRNAEDPVVEDTATFDHSVESARRPEVREGDDPGFPPGRGERVDAFQNPGIRNYVADRDELGQGGADH